MDLVKVATVAAGECIRQEVGLDRLVWLLDAYRTAVGFREAGMRLPTRQTIMSLAEIVEPDNYRGFRHVNVTFLGGGSAAHHGVVEDAANRHFDILEIVNGSDPVEVFVLAKEWVRIFLGIHPFIDGNGRTAWILYNWIVDSLDAPSPLPDFNW